MVEVCTGSKLRPIVWRFLDWHRSDVAVVHPQEVSAFKCNIGKNSRVPCFVPELVDWCLYLEYDKKSEEVQASMAVI